MQKIKPGLTEDTIREISKLKKEPKWMLEERLQAFRHFLSRPIPTWGADLSEINFDNLRYFVRPGEEVANDWNDVPEEIKNTFDKLGIPEAEKKFLAGTASQYESEMVYLKLKKKWEEQGIIFEDTDSALQKYPDMFKEYFGSVITFNDNKFASLNTAVWSGGVFIYVPKGVKLDQPLQTYFRINLRDMGQFERTVIVADEGAEIHYIEGCTAPFYSSHSLHTGTVEIICKPGSRVRYTTVQNWSKNVYNLVTQRAHVYKDAVMEWVDCNLGSKATMKYPAVVLKGERARGEILSIAVAENEQWQDAGAKAMHLAPNTSSKIVSKTVTKTGGRSSYRGLVTIPRGMKNAKSHVVCDALILDNESQTDTYPTNINREKTAIISHEASVSKVSEDQLFYLMSRGLSEEEASSLIVQGFIEPIMKQLPMEYAKELNALIEMSMEGSVG